MGREKTGWERKGEEEEVGREWVGKGKRKSLEAFGSKVKP